MSYSKHIKPYYLYRPYVCISHLKVKLCTLP